MAEGFKRSCASKELLDSGPGDAARLICICGALSAVTSGRLASGTGPFPLCKPTVLIISLVSSQNRAVLHPCHPRPLQSLHENVIKLNAKMWELCIPVFLGYLNSVMRP